MVIQYVNSDSVAMCRMLIRSHKSHIMFCTYQPLYHCIVRIKCKQTLRKYIGSFCHFQ